MDNESSFEGQSCTKSGLLCGGSGGFCFIQCVSTDAGRSDAGTALAVWTGCPGGP